MAEIVWRETDKHVYGAIYREHWKELSAFETFTDPDGCYGLPTTVTAWGFKAADFPLIKSIGTKKDRLQKYYDYEYFIAIIQNEDE